jgi:ribosomal RNA-processing protein 12
MKAAASTVQPNPPRLAFFQTMVLSLARSCDKLAAAGTAKDQRAHRDRVIALWSLFPCFCKHPADIESTVPTFTATLGRALEDKRYPELLVSWMGS